MARTTSEIQQSIIDSIQADVNLSVLNSVSKTAIWRLLTYIVASCVWTLEKIFDTHKAEVTDIVSRQKPHRLRWYASKVKEFQLGFNLLDDSDLYDNTGYTQDQIDASKIVKYSAVVELEKKLRIKIATEENGDLAQIPADKLIAINEYLNRIKDAGVKISLESLPPDKIKAKLDIYYDPLILDANGQRLDGTGNEPVQNAFKNYLKNGVPFNGTFVIAYLIDDLQAVEGVIIPQLISCSASYGDTLTPSIGVMYEPDAGYLRFENDSDLELQFIAQSAIK